MEFRFEYGDKLILQMTWQLVYRLLPCFVASYADLCTDDMVSAEAKEFYGQFIGKLIENYCEEQSTNPGYVGDVSICFLKWKFDCVASELKVRLYGDTKPANVTRQLQEKCFDVLTDYLGRVDQTTCSTLCLQWSSLLYDFADRMQSCLLQLTKLPIGLSRPMVGIEEYALSTLCRMLASAIFEKQGFKDKLEFSDSRVLIGSLFVAYAKSEKLKILKLPSSVSKSQKYWSAVQSTVETESKKLSEQQRLGLALYLCLSSNTYNTWVSRNSFSLPDEAVLDSLELLYFQVSNLATVAEKIPLLMSPKLSQVSLRFAKETAPTCYSPVLDRVVDGKVKMDAPGQNTFCPVPHCRWCGLVKNPSEMLVCQFCADKPKYPDTHLFCSSECEDLAMKDQHGERHAEFLEYGLGLKNVNPYFNVPFESPNCIMFK
jgi:hypothetical protein